MSFIRIPLRIIFCLVRPPWGIMFFIAGIIVFLAVTFGNDFFAKFQNNAVYQQLENAKVDQKNEIAQHISQLTQTSWSPRQKRQYESNVKLLVYGLSSKEEATALACHRALKTQLSDWRAFSNQDVSLYYYTLSQILAENLKSLNSPYSLNLARDLAQQIQNDILDRGIEKQYVVSENCRRVIEMWQAGQSHPVALAGINSQPIFDTTLASAGEPRNARFSGINVPYLTAEQKDTLPEGRLRQLVDYSNFAQNEMPDISQPSNLPKEAAIPRVGFYSLQSARPVSQNENRVLIARQEPRNLPPENMSPFLDDNLQHVAVNDLAKLTTQDLMRLLNHENWDISQKSESLLKNRDGFQEEHIQLASKLYHPDVSVRKSILPQLMGNDQLETSSWLSELLKDPEYEVRLAAAKAVWQIPLDEDSLESLKNVMKSDTDRQIAALGRELEMRISMGNQSQQYR